MNYGTTTYVYGPSYLPLTYTKDELDKLIRHACLAGLRIIALLAFGFAGLTRRE